MIGILLFVLFVACIYGSGRLTKASGRSPCVGYLLALFLGGILGLFISGLVLVFFKRPDDWTLKEEHDSGWGVIKPSDDKPFYGPPPGRW